MARSNLPVIGALLASLAAIGLASLLAWHQLSAPAGEGQQARSNGEAIIAPGVSVGGPFTLTDANGNQVSQADFADRHMLLYFGYTSCPDICPTELASMAAAVDILADKDQALAERVVPLFITVDPERDTPEVIGNYTGAFHPDMIGLTGDLEAIDNVAKSFRVFYSYAPPEEDGFYLVNHSGFVYLMGPGNDFVTMFHGGTAPDDIAQALARYVSQAEPTS